MKFYNMENNEIKVMGLNAFNISKNYDFKVLTEKLIEITEL